MQERWKSRQKVIYAAQFGLKKKPFALHPEGPEVFVGPQAATFISRFRDACARSDAIITVSGPRGTGKTTLVRRALEQSGLRRKTVTIDGEPLPAGEVLASLLTLFGLSDLPDSKDEQLATWRQLLSEHRAANIHVCIVVENALAAGADVIAELVTIRAACSEEVPGARMIIMGDENLGDLLETVELEGLRERVSLTDSLAPFCEAEVRGYLTHSLRIAGADFGTIFEEDCVALLHQLSEGIPRAINTIVETVLNTATEQQVRPITAKLTAEVAAEAYDATPDRFGFRPPVSADASEKAAGNADTGRTSAAPATVQMPDLEALARAISRAHGDGDDAPDPSRAASVPPSSAPADADEKLEGVQRRLAEARTLDDVDDVMAETLFGNELELNAAKAVGN